MRFFAQYLDNKGCLIESEADDLEVLKEELRTTAKAVIVVWVVFPNGEEQPIYPVRYTVSELFARGMPLSAKCELLFALVEYESNKKKKHLIKNHSNNYSVNRIDGIKEEILYDLKRIGVKQDVLESLEKVL